MPNHGITLEEIIEVRERESWREGRIEGERKGKREGKREGRIEGRIETCYEFGLSVKQIAEKLSVSEEYVERVLELEAENV